MDQQAWWTSLGIAAFAVATAIDGHPNVAMLLLLAAFARPVYYEIRDRAKERGK